MELSWAQILTGLCSCNSKTPPNCIHWEDITMGYFIPMICAEAHYIRLLDNIFLFGVFGTVLYGVFGTVFQVVSYGLLTI